MNNNFDYNIYNDYQDDTNQVNSNNEIKNVINEKYHKPKKINMGKILIIGALTSIVLMLLIMKFVKVEVVGVNIVESSFTMFVNETKTLNAIVFPTNATNKNIEWSSSNANVASIDNKGQVLAKTKGTTIITVKTIDGNYKDSINVTVKSSNSSSVAVSGVKINQSNFELKIGESKKLSVTITPSKASNKKVKWSSSNVEVASIDGNGKVVAKSQGAAIITVKTVDGNYKASVNVTVKPNSNPFVAVNGVKINQSNFELKVGESKILSATVTPSNATNKNVEWSSSNTSVAYIDATGQVVARSQGTAIITVKTIDGNYKASVNVTVKSNVIGVSSVKINQSNFELKVGESKTLSATVTPSNATNKNIEWSSSNPSIATIDANGRVVAKSQGTAALTVKTIDGNHKDSINVTVKPNVISVSDIQVSKSSVSIDVGSSTDVTVNVLPSNASNKTFTCSSSNSNVASSSVNGSSCKITGVASGTTKVTVYSHDKQKSAIINVTVEVPKNVVNINVATWNVHRYRDANKEKIGEKIVSLNLDIIGIQETRSYADSSAKEESNSKYVLGEIGKITGLKNYYYTHTPAGNAVLSKRSFVSKSSTGLASCYETRGLQKTVINVNNVDISFYNTHLSYQTNCPQLQLESAYNVIKNDVNPVILVGDFNIGEDPSVIVNTLGSGYNIIAHDTNRQIYADSIIINGKGKMKYVEGSGKTIVTTGVLSDHNLVMATLSVIN